MTTLLYGETPGADVEPGNRADLAESDGPPSSCTTQTPRTIAVAAIVNVPVDPPMRPNYPTPVPWHRPPIALNGFVLGVAAAAAVFAGLALFAVALTWSNAMTLFAQMTLMIFGGLLLAAGVTYVASAHPETA